jgi:coenzyme F420 hydrogenase subunit delta
MKTDVTPEYIKKRVLILGCGNTLFGDDGFGPETVAYIRKNCEIPNDVHVMDVGTGASKLLLVIALSEKKPEKLIMLDAVNVERKPGEIFKASIEDLLKNRVDNFSSHLFPTARLLEELQDKGVNIIILACQIEKIPDVVSSGLSESVSKAVPKAAKIALKLAK